MPGAEYGCRASSCPGGDPMPPTYDVRDVDHALRQAVDLRAEIARLIGGHYAAIAKLVAQAADNDEAIEQLLDHRNVIAPVLR